MARVPLARHNLVHNRGRFLLSAAGITFAVVLLCMQLGFLNGMFDAQVELLRRLDGELLMVSPAKYTIATKSPFPYRRLHQAAAVDGVESARPLYIEYELSLWRNPNNGIRQPIRVLGIDPDAPALRDPDVLGRLEKLKLPDTALFDTGSKDVYGTAIKENASAELAAHSVVIVGTFHLGTDFINDGNLVMSDRNFLKLFGHQRTGAEERGVVEIGVLRIERGHDPLAVQAAADAALPDDVVVMTRQQLMDQEMAFWRGSTPIGALFMIGVVMGFFIGVVICYQILFTDVVDHMPQFGTLKAMGFSKRFLLFVVLEEALLLAISGLVPGLLIGRLLYDLVGGATGLPMRLTVGRAGLVVVATILMCVVSGLIAARRLRSADPAELFA